MTATNSAGQPNLNAEGGPERKRRVSDRMSRIAIAAPGGSKARLFEHRDVRVRAGKVARAVGRRGKRQGCRDWKPETSVSSPGRGLPAPGSRKEREYSRPVPWRASHAQCENPAMARLPQTDPGITPEPIRTGIDVSINGEHYRHTGDPDMPLLWYLRDV